MVTARLGSARSAGFTLVELLVVIAIVGLVLGTVMVSMESLLPGERLNASVRHLASELARVRAEAISRNMEFQLEYDIPGGRYRVATPFRKGGGTLATFDDPLDDEERWFGPWKKLQSGVAFQSIVIGGIAYTDGSVRVRFDPLGAASDHTVILTQPAYENAFSIEVLALTGLIRMHAGVFFREPPDDADFN